MKKFHKFLLSFFVIFITCWSYGQTTTLPVKGWAKNSVNAVIFRKNAVVTFDTVQYTAFYDSTGHVVLGKRTLGTTDWDINVTEYTGNIEDAHNSISIMVDGAGYLHVSWDHHDNQLRYSRAVSPGSMELGEEMAMIGSNEASVTYPEFHRLPNGDLLFMYRDGGSGDGNMVMNRYDHQDQSWERLHSNLIDGEGQRNAYWQAHVDTLGRIHLSWVWRETWDVATNHDICYAVSLDGGVTWQRSTEEQYTLPITAATSEYAAEIPQNSELINQTSIYGDGEGNPYICNYWTPEGSDVPQFHLVYHDGNQWQTVQVSDRTTPFSLSGGGTRRIPISRPQVMVDDDKGNTRVFVLYRDEEQGNKVTLTYCEDISTNDWTILNLTDYVVGSWEPSYDTELWKEEQLIHIFVQRVGQGDGEGLEDLPAQPVTILEWSPEMLEQTDCNGDAGGMAYVDTCGTCVGGNTGAGPCLLDEGYYTIRPVHSQLCLQAGDPVRQQACSQQDHQVWELVRQENGQYQLISLSGGYLSEEEVTAGGVVTVSEEASSYHIEDAGSGHFHVVQPQEQHLVLDINANSTDAGMHAIFWDRTGGDNQKYMFDKVAVDCSGEIDGTAYMDECDQCVGGNTGEEPCIVTAMEQNTASGIDVYPNPSHKTFLVNQDGVFHYRVVNMTGVKVAEGNCEGSCRIGQRLPAGLYLLEVTAGENNTITRLVKQ